MVCKFRAVMISSEMKFSISIEQNLKIMPLRGKNHELQSTSNAKNCIDKGLLSRIVEHFVGLDIQIEQSKNGNSACKKLLQCC